MIHPSLEYRVGGTRPSVRRTVRRLVHYPRGIAVIALSSPLQKGAFSASQEIFGRREVKGSDTEEEGVLRGRR